MVATRSERRKSGWSTAAQDIVDRIFVYGTLRSGQHARSMIDDHVVSAQPATMSGRIFSFAEGYPGYIAGDDGVVVGELVVLRDLTAAFLLLDAYEGDDFDRVLRKARTADGTEHWAWVYILADEGIAERGALIPSGDWADV